MKPDRRFSRWSLLLGMAGAVSGCGKSDPADPATEREEPEEEVALEDGTRIDAEEGGSVESDDGRVTLTIPEDALERDTRIAIRRVTEADWPAAVEDSAPLDRVYEFLPHGLEFAEPATLAMRVDVEIDDDDYPELLLLSWNEDEDEPVELEAVTTDYTFGDGTARVEAPIESFSWKWATQGYVTFRANFGDATQRAVGENWSGKGELRNAFNRTVTGSVIVVRTHPVVPLGDHYNFSIAPDTVFSLAPDPSWTCEEVGPGYAIMSLLRRDERLTRLRYDIECVAGDAEDDPMSMPTGSGSVPPSGSVVPPPPDDTENSVGNPVPAGGAGGAPPDSSAGAAGQAGTGGTSSGGASTGGASSGGEAAGGNSTGGAGGAAGAGNPTSEYSLVVDPTLVAALTNDSEPFGFTVHTATDDPRSLEVTVLATANEGILNPPGLTALFGYEYSTSEASLDDREVRFYCIASGTWPIQVEAEWQTEESPFTTIATQTLQIEVQCESGSLPSCGTNLDCRRWCDCDASGVPDDCYYDYACEDGFCYEGYGSHGCGRICGTLFSTCQGP